MSKKNRAPWPKPAPAPTEPRMSTSGPAQAPDAAAPAIAPISPAQLAANRANAQLSTGPRTAAGLARSSQNAVKSALTGRTVLLPTDDIEEYARFLAGFQHDFKPVGPIECELVQIVVDCFWRQRRIQALEFALYAHGHEQFEDAFNDLPEAHRYNRIVLQTHMTYEKQFRNFQIQEARLDRKRAKAMAELERLQKERKSNEQPSETQMSDDEFFAALDAGYVPLSLAAQVTKNKIVSQNGFVFSNARNAALVPDSVTSKNLKDDSKAA